jgi:hypothetical protein
MAFARQHDGVARFRHTKCASFADGTDLAPSADHLHRVLIRRAERLTREAPAHLRWSNTDSSTRRGKAGRAAKLLRDVRARFSPLRAPWRVSKSSIVVFSPPLRNTREPSRGRRSRWPCGWAGWSGGPLPRGVGFSMTLQARRGSGGHRVPKLHCRIRQHCRASPPEAVGTTCGSASVLGSPVESLGRTGVDQWFRLTTSVRTASSQGRAGDTYWLDGRSSLK